MIATCLISGVVCAESLVVIVNPKAAVTSMTQEQVANVFMGKANDVGGISPVSPTDLKSEDSKNEFYTKVLKRDNAQMKAYWAKMSFTGKGLPPKELATSDEVRRFVAATPGAIGYIDKSAADSSVKVVLSVN
ncbi:hypothetical protein KSF73_11770 [Burkholderiaceae bacterium DAT-1]|nr:hypothetical protein [Burkholderiaceae bacterium DAT-1]